MTRKPDPKYSSPLPGQKGMLRPVPKIKPYNYNQTYSSSNELKLLIEKSAQLAQVWDIIVDQDLTLADRPERVTGQTLDELFAEDDDE